MFLTRPFATSFVGETSKYFWRDLPLYLAIAAYVIVGLAYVHASTKIPLETFRLYAEVWSMNFLVVAPGLLFVAGIARIVHGVERRRLLALRHMFSPKRTARFVAGSALLMALMLFQATFTSIKNTLSRDGFKFDQVQADIDKFIHGGIDPWRILYGITDNRYVLSAIEINYNAIWFILCFATLYWACTSPKADGIRTRYVLSFMLVWIIIGNILAGMYISAGPVYYGLVTGDMERFAEQLAVIAQNEGGFSSAYEYQQYLWLLYSTGNTGFASGISAFPSVHVGLITLNALFLYEYNKKLGLLAFAYTGFIIMSSVYLAWHYAIDGYVSVIVTLVIFYALKNLPLAGLNSLWFRSAVYGADTNRTPG